MSEPKSIQVIPKDQDTDAKVSEIAKQLRTSRSGLAGIALDFAVSALAKGKAKVVNGELVIDKAA